MSKLFLSLVLVVTLAACVSSADPSTAPATKDGTCNGLSNVADPATASSFSVQSRRNEGTLVLDSVKR